MTHRTLTPKQSQALIREVIGLRVMFTRSLTRRINVEHAMGQAMTAKLWRVFETLEAVLAPEEGQAP